jgi:tetrahydromethanopterin S-methyltransferase subunit D
MTAVAAKPAAGSAMNPTAMVVGGILLLILLAICYAVAPVDSRFMVLMALVGVIIGGVLIGFGVHFVPVGGAPAAMGQAPGIATGVAMLAAGAGLAGLFGGAWAAASSSTGAGFFLAIITGGVGGGMMMAITCMMVNFVYVFGMGIPAASGKVLKDPITGDSQPEYKSQGTEGHGLPFVSFVGGVIGGILGGAGGTLIYIELLNLYQATLPNVMNITASQALPIAVSVAGTFAIGMFLVNAVLTAYNITGTIEGPHDPKFKRWPRSVVASAVASALCGLVAILIVMF